MRYLILVIAMGSIIFSGFVLSQKSSKELEEAKGLLLMYSEVMTYYGTNCDFVSYDFVKRESTPYVGCVKLVD